MKLADVFSDGIVLQRGKPISVWGTGNDGTTICVELNQENDCSGWLLEGTASADESGYRLCAERF